MLTFTAAVFSLIIAPALITLDLRYGKSLQRRHTPMAREFLITSMVVILIPGTGVIYTLATGSGAAPA